jgi:hypothetical protein
MGYLATEHGELLAQDKQLEVLRARRPAGEEQDPENLARRESVIRRTVTGTVSLPVDWCVGPNQVADRDVAPFKALGR